MITIHCFVFFYLLFGHGIVIILHGLVWICIQVVKIEEIKWTHDCSYDQDISRAVSTNLRYFLFTLENRNKLPSYDGVHHDKIYHLSICFFDIVRNRNLSLRWRFKHVNLGNFADTCRLPILSTEKIEKLMMKLNIRLCLNSVTFTSCFPSVFQETQIFTFGKALIHNWPSLAHKFLQIKCLIRPFVLIFQHIFFFVVVVIIILRSLIENIYCTVLLSLNFLVDIVVSCR